MRIHNTKLINQRGMSLIEIMIVLIIGGVIVAAVAPQAFNAFSSNENTTLVRQNITLHQGLRSMYGGNYSVFDLNATLNSRTAVPQEMKRIPGQITDTLGAAVIVASANGGLNFTTTYKNKEGGVCTDFVSNSVKGGGFASITVNGGANITNVAQAGNACNQASNTIVFTNR